MDLNHLECSEEDDDPHMPIVDKLVDLLPERDSKPYLSLFVLSHPDQDHCRGFAELLKRCTIGEIWHSPRIFREYSRDLCDDAKAFQREVSRRVKKMIASAGIVESGDRVRLIGYDDLLSEGEYKGFPKQYLTVPGNVVSKIDHENVGDVFEAFIHAPFKDDCSGDRNDTSLSMQVTLKNGKHEAAAIFFGDHCYPIMKRIFERSNAARLAWNILLAPHHCSKKVMYWKEEGEEEECLKQNILDAIEAAAKETGYIIASCEPIPKANSVGDNPPHAKAKNRYLEMVPNDFLCTQEHGDGKQAMPIAFEFSDDGISYIQPEKSKQEGKNDVRVVVATARGGQAPREQVGFGKSND